MSPRPNKMPNQVRFTTVGEAASRPDLGMERREPPRELLPVSNMSAERYTPWESKPIVGKSPKLLPGLVEMENPFQAPDGSADAETAIKKWLLLAIPEAS